MKTERLRHLSEIAKHYGEEHQQQKAIEECAELILAICKNKDRVGSVDDVVDEIADVEIMLNQLKILFGCFCAVEDRIEFKIDRQLERIRKGE